MQIHVKYTEKELRQLILKDLEGKMGSTPFNDEDVIIEGPSLSDILGVNYVTNLFSSKS